MAAPFHVVFVLSGTQSMNARVGFYVSAFTALFVATLLIATGSGFAAEGSASDPAQVARGKALYGTNCLHCHGINMVTPGTAAFDLREFPHDDKARFVNSVTHGKNNRMPPWGDILKPEDIDNLWAYVLTGGKP
jgi:mono/diheme cytochrome c family protein